MKPMTLSVFPGGLADLGPVGAIAMTDARERFVGADQIDFSVW